MNTEEIREDAEQVEEIEKVFAPAPVRRRWLARKLRPRGKHNTPMAVPAQAWHEDTEALYTPQELAGYERWYTRNIQRRPWWKKLGWSAIATALLCVLPVLSACVYVGAHYSITHTEYVAHIVHGPAEIRDITHWRLANGRTVTTVGPARTVTKNHTTTRTVTKNHTRTVTVTKTKAAAPQPTKTVKVPGPTVTVTATPQPGPTVTVTATPPAPAVPSPSAS